MVDIRTSEMDAKIAPVSVQHRIVYADRSSNDEQLLIGPFL
jgi:hypothetical protein